MRIHVPEYSRSTDYKSNRLFIKDKGHDSTSHHCVAWVFSCTFSLLSNSWGVTPLSFVILLLPCTIWNGKFWWEAGGGEGAFWPIIDTTSSWTVFLGDVVVDCMAHTQKQSIIILLVIGVRLVHPRWNKPKRKRKSTDHNNNQTSRIPFHHSTQWFHH